MSHDALQGHTLIFTGHSKGGAVAALAALQLLDAQLATEPAYANNIKFVGFGTPPYCGPDALQRNRAELQRHSQENNCDLTSSFLQFACEHDPVPQVFELAWLAWRHYFTFKVSMQLFRRNLWTGGSLFAALHALVSMPKGLPGPAHTSVVELA